MTVIKVALTGGIATGKSYVLARLASRHVPTIDADSIAHRVTRGHAPAVDAIRQHFGSGIFGSTGDIDRQKLADRVFCNSADRRALEMIVHPLVRAEIKQWFEQMATDGRLSFAVATIPLLFETGQQETYDRIIVTTCPRDIQLDRLRARGLTQGDAERRIGAQIPDNVRLAGADFVIQTGGLYADTDHRVDIAYEALRGRGPS